MTRKRADYTVDLDEGLAAYDDAEAEALKRLKKDGLSLHEDPPRWEDGTLLDGRIPANLASLTPTEIGEYHNMMVVYADYVSGRATVAKALMVSANEKLKLTKAKVRKAKEGSAQSKEDDTICDVRYVAANATYVGAKTYHELLSNVEAAARRDVAFISRLIETKKIEFEQGRRVENARGGGRQTFRKPSGERRKRRRKE